MRRSTLIKACHQVSEAIESSSLISALRTDGKNSAVLLTAFNKYSIAAHSFSQEARAVERIFELGDLHLPEAWGELIEPTPRKRRIYSQLIAAHDVLPRILRLMTQDTPQVSTEINAYSKLAGENLSLIKVILIEEDAHFSTAQRVIDSLAACQEMYDALAAMNDMHSIPLGIGAIDSGSDKSFDLFGAAELVKQLNQLILSIWDLVVFHKERKIGRNLELISTSLPILAQINELEASGKLGREQAEIIRRGIVDGAAKFLGTGTVTEEMDQISTTNPRVLMAPEPKLLTAPQPHGSGSGQSDTANRAGRNDRTLPEMSESDLRKLAKYLREDDNGHEDEGS